MEYVDANIVLRYILCDIQEQAERAGNILENSEVILTFEVIAEIIYVLDKIYKVKRADIKNSIQGLLLYKNISIGDKRVLSKSLELYTSENIDFIDSILLSYNRVRKAKIYIFDKRLMKLLR